MLVAITLELLQYESYGLSAEKYRDCISQKIQDTVENFLIKEVPEYRKWRNIYFVWNTGKFIISFSNLKVFEISFTGN